jgi:hypothetical protein
MKHRLLVEKDKGNACRKNQEKKRAGFLANFFRGLSFYGPDCTKAFLIFYEIKSKEVEKECHETVFTMEEDIGIKLCGIS